MNDGIFPASLSSGGLITENEKMILEGSDIHISHSARKSFQTEKLVCYNAFTLADEKLFVLYSESDLVGEVHRPSALVSELNGMFGQINTKAQDMGLDFTALLSEQLTINIWNIPVIKTLQFLRLGLCWGYRRNMPRNLCEQRSFHENGDYKLEEKTAEKLFM